jgi:hypothetical protein
MDQAQYDQLKDNWAEVEDRDGVRLAWNVFASTRMEASRLVVPIRQAAYPLPTPPHTLTDRQYPHHPDQRTQQTPAPVRACRLQTSLPCRPQPF